MIKQIYVELTGCDTEPLLLPSLEDVGPALEITLACLDVAFLQERRCLLGRLLHRLRIRGSSHHWLQHYSPYGYDLARCRNLGVDTVPPGRACRARCGANEAPRFHYGISPSI